MTNRLVTLNSGRHGDRSRMTCHENFFAITLALSSLNGVKDPQLHFHGSGWKTLHVRLQFATPIHSMSLADRALARGSGNQNIPYGNLFR